MRGPLLRLLGAAGLVLSLFVGCSVSTDVPGDSAPVIGTPDPPASLPVELLSSGHGALMPPPLAANAGIRTRRRMDIDQLNASVRQVTGGVFWSEERGNTEVDLFEDLSATLGRPDYLQQTQEDLEVSLLFQKFLGDAARDVCGRLAEQEREAAAADRYLLISVEPTDTLDSAPAAVEENLRALLLRYHGHSVAPESGLLNRWRWLFQSTVHLTGDPVIGWRAVCVGLMTHPDFFTY